MRRGTCDGSRRIASGVSAVRMLRRSCAIGSHQDTSPSSSRRPTGRLPRLKTFAEYYQFLKFSPQGKEELDEMTDLITTNETYFFREDYQLRAFRDQILPLIARDSASRKRLSVWSAGCSTGEEVYTLS